MEADSKKRKRSPGTSASLKPKVHIVATNTDHPPVLAFTPGIKLSEQLSFQPYNKPCKPQSSSEFTSSLYLHSSSHARIDYVGKEESDQGLSTQLKHYIGIFNPKTDDLHITQARKIVVRGTIRKENEELEEQIKRTNREKINTLSQAFGTKKAKKVADSYTKNAIAPGGRPVVTTEDGKPVELDAEASAILESMGPAQESLAKNQDVLAAIDNAKPRPRPNLEATKAADVYTIESLVGSDMLKQLSVVDWIDAAKNGSDINTLNRFVAARSLSLARLSDTTGEHQQMYVKRLKALKYCEMLLDFHRLLKSEGRKPKKVLPDEQLAQSMNVQPGVVAHIKQRFAQGSQMSKWHMDNIRTYIAALALVIDGLSVDTFLIQEDLGLEKKAITQYYMELGCRIKALTTTQKLASKIPPSEARQHQMADLQLPLEFPKPKTGRGRGR